MVRYLLLIPALCSPLAMAASPVTIDIAAGLLQDNNITNGKSSRDIEKDLLFNGEASAAYNHSISNSSSLSITGNLALQQYQDFDKLNNTDLNLLLGYHLQPGRSYTSPWYSISVKLGMREYSSDFRDGNYYELAVTMGRRLTDKTTLRAGLSQFSANADNDIFDVDYNRLYLSLDLKPDVKNTLYGTLSFYSGDVISTNVPPHPPELNSIAWVDDDAYPSLSSPWTYRLDADTLALQVGDNYAISSRQSVDASISYYDSDADNNFTYNRSLLQFNYLYRF